ncbi:DNA polymerase III, delta subunit [Candidatus Glomeribacter gigasporarum BEG34]|uniref:DNA polymerase III subunit delta n=1 Tax=Candidatus Glomeribacter gigasporarum BEG34 TaxID=1070319 RepID=G2J813_9BURK|nr:DNA polymerase III subunit delta [Candidatus Glomeribacter gigasporarum]CCD28910.1 DNA polymerase III, delta subunit [Candidatus Glomeribacter gigasporarum BEG34]
MWIDNADALAGHLSRGLARCYAVCGNEPLLVQEALDQIRRHARAQSYTERAIFTVERGFDWSMPLGLSCSPALFGERRLLDLRIPNGQPGKAGAAALQSLCAADSPDLLILITLPRPDAAAQKSAWYHALLNAGVVVCIERVERAHLPNWLKQRLEAQNQRAPAGEEGARALQWLAERVEGNLLAAHQEIQKLGLLYPPGELSVEQIQTAVLDVARYDVFKLGEAMLSGDVARLARMLDGLRGEGAAPVFILWALAEELRALWRIKQGLAAGRPLTALTREARVWGAREKLIGPAAQRVSMAALHAALTFAARLDRQLKGLPQPFRGEPRGAMPQMDPWRGLFELAMRISAPEKSMKNTNERIFQRDCSSASASLRSARR